LFDFSEVVDNTPGSIGWRSESLESLSEAEVCVEVEGDGSFTLMVNGTPLPGKLKYIVSGSIHRRGRYVVESSQLDAFVVDSNSAGASSFVKAINKTQALRVVPAAPDLTYARKTFYKAGLNIDAIARGDIRGTPFEYLRESAWLQHVSSEKGSSSSIATWVNESIFGGVYAHYGLPAFGRQRGAFVARPIRGHDPGLADELDQFEVVVCDDGGQEWADFMLVSEGTRRVVFVHAMVNDSEMSLNAMQIVGRQAQAGISFMTRGPGFASRAAWWMTPWSMDDGRQVSRRVLKGASTDLNSAWKTIETAVLSGLYKKEIWIWAGRTLSKSELLRQLTRTGGPSSRSRQMAYYLAALQTSAARASIAMQIFCSP
jgi:hypothetical protein